MEPVASTARIPHGAALTAMAERSSAEGREAMPEAIVGIPAAPVKEMFREPIPDIDVAVFMKAQRERFCDTVGRRRGASPQIPPLAGLKSDSPP